MALADGDALGQAIRRCPFLHRVSCSEGEAFARNLALSDPRQPSSKAPAEPASLDAVLRLWHGDAGVVPLKRLEEATRAPPSARCPHHAGKPAAGAATQPPEALAAAPCRPAARPPFGGAPVASISMGFSFLGDPGKFFRARLRRRRRQQGKQQQQPTSEGGGTKPRPNPGGKPPAAQSAGSVSRVQPSPERCPMRGYLEPLGALLPAVTAAGRLECPVLITRLRAAVAALRPVRGLRPQSLPVRALAMGTTAILLNVPCGAWREHTRKFSPQWFLAVHATIPFVAMLRKAVLMPPWAVLLTIAGAIAGQQAGAKLERARLLHAPPSAVVA